MLTISHLTKYYVKTKPVISDLNLTFGDTGFNLIVGKSGCGKTTLLNMIGTMDQDYIGSIEFNGRELSTMSYEKISEFRNFTSGYIFQINSLFYHMTVEQNIKLALDLQNKKADISSILEKVGLKGFENRKVKYLSGGERQRVGIARAIAKDAKIILADEPTSALDSNNAHQIFALLKEISKDRLVIAVTHDTKKAFQYADRVIKLVDGRVVEDEVINNPTGKAIEYKRRRPKKTTLLPIFWSNIKNNFIINLFIVILMTLVLTIANVAVEQDKIKKEYDYYYGNREEIPFNELKTLTTHYYNNIDYYYVMTANEEDEPYKYFQTVSNRKEGLSEDDMEITSQFFKDYNIHIFEYEDIIIEGISQMLKFSTEVNGYKYYWEEPQRTSFDYFLYDENNTYDLMAGRLPEEKNEILITDTIADAYLNRNDLDNSDLTVLLDQELTIYDIYHKVDNYYYHVKKPFKVVGIIKTDQLGFYQFSQLSNRYELLSFFKQQYREDPYMNTAFSNPYGYIVTMEHLDANRNVSFYYDLLNLENIYLGDRAINNTVAAFVGEADYRGIEDYEDDLIKDVNRRIIVKDSLHAKLQDNEIIITNQFLRYLEPTISPWNYPAIVNVFNNEYNGKEITLTFYNGVDYQEITFKIVGIARQSNDNEFYVSEEIYHQLDVFINGVENRSMIVELKDVNPKERIELISELYELGYVLNPVNMLPPGAYLEFVETQGEIEVVDEEGFSEIINMSLYHLFSEFYNTKEMNEANSVLEVFDSIYVFCLVMGILISLGLIFLKERKQKDTILLLSQLGVSTRKIVIINILNYFVVATLIGVLTIFLSYSAVNYINDIFTIQTIKAMEPEVILGGQIHRIRLIFTDSSIKTGIIAAIIVFIVGSYITRKLTFKYRR